MMLFLCGNEGRTQIHVNQSRAISFAGAVAVLFSEYAVDVCLDGILKLMRDYCVYCVCGALT